MVPLRGECTPCSGCRERERKQEQCVDSVYSDKLGIGANVYVRCRTGCACCRRKPDFAPVGPNSNLRLAAPARNASHFPAFNSMIGGAGWRKSWRFAYLEMQRERQSVWGSASGLLHRATRAAAGQQAEGSRRSSSSRCTYWHAGRHHVCERCCRGPECFTRKARHMYACSGTRYGRNATAAKMTRIVGRRYWIGGCKHGRAMRYTSRPVWGGCVT